MNLNWNISERLITPQHMQLIKCLIIIKSCFCLTAVCWIFMSSKHSDCGSCRIYHCALNELNQPCLHVWTEAFIDAKVNEFSTVFISTHVQQTTSHCSISDHSVTLQQFSKFCWQTRCSTVTFLLSQVSVLSQQHSHQAIKLSGCNVCWAEEERGKINRTLQRETQLN